MREAFVRTNFRKASLEVIRMANVITAEYQDQGYDLTLRQVYYQFVSRGWLANTDRSYDRLGSIINNARMSGLMDWDDIVDRTRYLRSPNHWSSPSQLVEQAASQYQEHLWRNQDHYVEVWVEKDALVGVVERACGELRLPFLSCRGFVSQSEMYSAGKRLARHSIDDKKDVHVVHLGDHDPSGLDMTRDITNRLTLFSEESVDVRRVALTMEQVNQYQPPPNPTKLSDSRASDYVRRYGYQSWELDALDPTVIIGLIVDEVTPFIDWDRWELDAEVEEQNKTRLTAVAARWNELTEQLDEND